MTAIQNKLHTALIDVITRIRQLPEGATDAQRLAHIDGRMAMRFEANTEGLGDRITIYAQIGWTTHLELSFIYRAGAFDVYLIGNIVAQRMRDATDVQRPPQGNATGTLPGVDRVVMFDSPGEILLTLTWNDGQRMEAFLALVDNLLDLAYIEYVRNFTN